LKSAADLFFALARDMRCMFSAQNDLQLLPTQEAHPMNAITSTASSTNAAFVTSGGSEATRYVVTVGETPCEVRARTIAMIAEVLGFEQEMEGEVEDLVGHAADQHLIADLLESRMIAPPRPIRRRQRSVC
jgi:hypothetical protein